jgi:hypothetical protein
MHGNSKTAKIRQTKCENTKKRGKSAACLPKLAVKNAPPKIAVKPSLPIRLETENFETKSRAQNKPNGHAAIQRENML